MMQTGTGLEVRRGVSHVHPEAPRALTPYTALSTNQGKRVDCAHQEDDVDNNRFVKTKLVQPSRIHISFTLGIKLI